MDDPQSRPPPPPAPQQAPPPPPAPRRPAFLNSLLLHNFCGTCRQSLFCFICARSFCPNCCHTHSTAHHPGLLRSVAEVSCFKDDWVISAEDVYGVGYNWSGIQRAKHNGKKVLYLRPIQQKLDQNKWLTCRCGDKMRCRADFCSVHCRLNNVLSGKGREMGAALVATNFTETRHANRFCTICTTPFSSDCCPDHIGFHHPGIDNVDHVIRIVRDPVNRSILTPRHGALIDVIFDFIHTIHIDGEVMIPLHKYNHAIVEGTLCLCSRIIAAEFLYCSLECKASCFWNK